jgi:hypothetical protein
VKIVPTAVLLKIEEFLKNNIMLVCGEFKNKPSFDGYKRIEIAGCETISLDVSGLRKVDGDLSCLSLGF